MSCCPPGSIGAAPLSSHQPKGRVETIEHSSSPEKNLPCYWTGKADSRRVILLFTDVFGVDSGNHKAVADRLSDAMNAIVIIPDLFRGKPILTDIPYLPVAIKTTLSLLRIAWAVKFRVTSDAIDEDLRDMLLPWVQSKTSTPHVSCMGFCFGGWVITKALSLSQVRCGVGLHPSFRLEDIIGGTPEKAAERVGSKPILLLPAINDDLKANEHPAVKILAEARQIPEDEVSVTFPTMKHGWVTRGDSNDPEVAACQTKALQMVVDFINKHDPLDE